MRPSQNLPLTPPPHNIPPPFTNYMRPSQNLSLPPRIYPPFYQLYATIPESTPTSQNIPPFLFLTTICDLPGNYHYLPEYTPPPPFNNYIYVTNLESTPLSQNIPPLSLQIIRFDMLFFYFQAPNHHWQYIHMWPEPHFKKSGDGPDQGIL